ncbi:hypothetical protein D3C71_234360 [compost metagenome]
MLQVISSDNKQVDLPPRCEVRVGNTASRYEEFVAFGYEEHTGEVKFAFNADALTLLKALVLLQQAATEAFNALEPDIKEEVRNLVWGAKPNENNS